VRMDWPSVQRRTLVEAEEQPKPAQRGLTGQVGGTWMPAKSASVGKTCHHKYQYRYLRT
jgi:hypothetical protein